MIKKEKYCVELNDNGVICGLFQAHHMSEFNLAHGGLGEICLTATDHQPRYQVRNANSFPSEGVPPKEFVSVLDFVPQFHLVSNDGSRFQYQNDDYHATLQYQFHNDCFSICASAQDPRIVQFGMNLRFSFLGADPETLAHQLVASTPYTSEDGSVTFFLMPRADGQFVLVTSSGDLDGWKLDYSEYNYGHFILNLKMLEQLDTCYKMSHSQEIHNMTLWVDFPTSLQEAYDFVFKRTGVPCASFNISGGLIGTVIPIQIHGVCDRVLLSTPTGAQQELVQHGAYVTVPLQEEGFYHVFLYYGRRSYDFKLFAYSSLQELCLSSLLAVKKPYHIDENLAEGGAWCWAMLSYMKIYGKDLRLLPSISEFFSQKLLVSEQSEAIPRCTIWPKEQIINGKIYQPWHIWQSTRIQEQFFGISILLEASHVLQDNCYLEYAVQTAESLLKDHIAPDGEIWRIDERGIHIDYTTVCAPVIALVDLARELSDRGDSRAAKWADVCTRIADYLVCRGFSFPTEAEPQYAGRELEDGSISCTALSVLYVCHWICRKTEYIDFAKRVLQFHDAWICYTPDVRMYCSTTRWWELLWEGDQNGPALCAGHAWTIWRAEADFYLARLTGDCEAAKQSYCAYLTNYCKVEADGNMTAAFVPDLLPYRTAEGEIGRRYPVKKDYSLSRYVWARSADTWFFSGGIFIKKHVVETIHLSYVKKGNQIFLRPAIENLELLFVSARGYTIYIKTVMPLQIVTQDDITIQYGVAKKVDQCTIRITPQDGQIVFSA